MGGANGAVTVRQSVNKDVASRRNALHTSERAVVLIWIRDVYCLVEPAVSVAEIEDVHSFGRPVISLSGLRPDRIASKSNPVGFDHLTSVEEFERPLFLEHHNVIRAQRGLRNGLRCQ